MKYFKTLLVLSLLFLPIFTIQAQTTYSVNSEDEQLFTVETGGIRKVSDTDITEFKMDVFKNDSENTISYWKVRSYCETGVKVNVNILGTNSDCGKAVTINRGDLKSFPVFFDPSKNTISKFSFKLKAYDVNGKWLHTEKKAFSWK